MKTRASFYFLFIGLVLSAVTTYLHLSFLEEQQEMVSVVVATKDLPPFHELTQADVKVVSLPVASVFNEQAVYATPTEVIGKYTASYLSKGAFLNTDNTAAFPGGELVVQLNQKKNMTLRAMEIPIVEKHLRQKIKAGDRITLLGTVLETKAVNGVVQNVKATEVIASHVEVLQANPDAPRGESPPMERTIIVEVTVEVAMKIRNAMNNGGLTVLAEPSFSY